MTSKRAVKLDQRAQRDLKRLYQRDRKTYERIKEKLFRLVSEPFIGKPLTGDKKGGLKLRVGDYRIIYEITPSEVWVIRIGHRREVYR